MSKLEFNHSNTHDILPRLQSGDISVGRAIELLNARLEEMLREQPEVYGLKGVNTTVWQTHHYGGCEHRARLVNVEALDGK